jgi:ribosomal protein S18 acetylase RimI-like enzyme
MEDLDWSLAHFTFVADVTTLVDDCDLVHSPAMTVANCHRFSLPALAFAGTSSDLLANYAAFLAEPGEAYLLVNEAQREVVAEAFSVLETIPEWQLVFQGDPLKLDPGEAEPLRVEHLSAMQALAQNGDLPMLEKDPFASGPAFGIWDGHDLISMATTRLRIPGAVEIGNIVTHKAHRRKGYATAVTSALVQALCEEDVCVFLMSYQSNTAALRLYKRLGFEIQRPMYLIRCSIEWPTAS